MEMSFHVYDVALCHLQEMERLMEAMTEEKQRLEQTTQDLQTQFEQISAELELTTKAMKEVESEKAKLAEQQNELSNLLSVSLSSHFNIMMTIEYYIQTVEKNCH